MNRGPATIATQPLGQVGFRFDFGGTVVYIDPYLSDSVREHEGTDLERLFPVPMQPADVRDADFVLVTHEHRDHCDHATLRPLASASPHCRFVGPVPVIESLARAGIDGARLIRAADQSLPLSSGLSVQPVPAAHPVIEPVAPAGWRCIGYLLRWHGHTIWHAGDTSVSDELIAHMRGVGRINIALLPVNENNYFRRRRGIIGNMSVREAFQLAEELGIRCVVPTHWDMFDMNSTFEAEIRLLHDKLRSPFRLLINPRMLELR